MPGASLRLGAPPSLSASVAGRLACLRPFHTAIQLKPRHDQPPRNDTAIWAFCMPGSLRKAVVRFFGGVVLLRFLVSMIFLGVTPMASGLLVALLMSGFEILWPGVCVLW